MNKLFYISMLLFALFFNVFAFSEILIYNSVRFLAFSNIVNCCYWATKEIKKS